MPSRDAANVKRGFTSADPETTAAVANTARRYRSMVPKRSPAQMLDALYQAIEDSRKSLNKIGEGDWTPQDTAHSVLLARIEVVLANVPFRTGRAERAIQEGRMSESADRPAASVWVATQSLGGGPDYSVVGVYTTREAALAALGGEIHPGAGRLKSLGGVGWELPEGGQAWKEDDDGSLGTFDAYIERWDVSE